jgi:polygalacturonase
MIRIIKCTTLLIAFIILSAFSKAEGQTFINVKSYGAVADGKTYDTDSIQKAIDITAENGGGTIYFPAGNYLTRTIVLKNNISLFLDNGCTILGSTDLNKFDPKFGSFLDSGGRKIGTTLVFAKNCKNISIEGNGTINGQGYKKYYPSDKGLARPSIIRFINCRFVKIKNITLINSAAWVQHYINCDDLLIDGITVRSCSNKNNDGLDVEGCQRVFITRCNIDSEDDSIVLKALTTRACRDVVISDCIISGLKSAIKTGTESIGNFENISISNCSIYGTRGLSLLAVDGGSIDNITISNISMRNTYAVIVLRLGNRMRKYIVPDSLQPKAPGTFKNVMINNIQAVGVTESNDFICGIPGHDVENVSISNLRIIYRGGGTLSDFNREIPERTNEYPKAKMFGNLPSYGFYIRHAKGISLKNVFLSYESNEERPVIYCDNVKDIELSGIKAKSPGSSTPYFFLKDVEGATLSNCSPGGRLKTFLQLEGKNTKGIKILCNKIGTDTKIFVAGSNVNKNNISIIK